MSGKVKVDKCRVAHTSEERGQVDGGRPGPGELRRDGAAPLGGACAVKPNWFNFNPFSFVKGITSLDVP